jgi:CheY-like chemotaxis protein
MTKSISQKNIVLYVDDDIDDLMMVQEAFSMYAQNVEVILLKDGIEALSYLKRLSRFDPTPCLIILDINMPKMNGREVLHEIRKMDRFNDVPVVMFTTSSQLQDKAFAIKYKAGFLTKPVDMTQLEIITNRFIEHCNNEVQKNIRLIK